MKVMIDLFLKIIPYHRKNRLNKVSNSHTLLAMKKIDKIQVCNYERGGFVYKMNIKTLR